MVENKQQVCWWKTATIIISRALGGIHIIIIIIIATMLEHLKLDPGKYNRLLLHLASAPLSHIFASQI